MNEENKSTWDEISEDVSEESKKIKEKVSQENLIDDLKDSFQSTIETSAEIIKNLINAVDSAVKDEEIKSEAKEVIIKINNELGELIESTKSKISNKSIIRNQEEE